MPQRCASSLFKVPETALPSTSRGICLRDICVAESSSSDQSRSNGWELRDALARERSEPALVRIDTRHPAERRAA